MVALAWIGEGDKGGTWFGSSVDAGDVNGDGYADLVVGSPGAGASAVEGEPADGGASAFFGSATGLATDPGWMASITNVDDASFGGTVRSAGDVNGDGFDDVAIAVAREDGYDHGTVQVLLGSGTGPGTTAAWTSLVSDQDPAGPAIVSGDVDKDGFSDLLVAGTDGFALYAGSAAGPTGPVWRSGYVEAQDAFGLAVVPALDHAVALVDLDGDGHLDLVAGAIGASDTDSGRVFVYPWIGPFWVTAPTTMIQDPVPGTWFGVAVAGGDVNGDGFGDVIVGAQHEDTEGDLVLEGGASLFLGSSSGLATTARWVASPPPPVFELGVSVAAGDVNGDGFDDVIVGSAGSPENNLLSRVFVYLGYPVGLAASFAWKEAGRQVDAGYGTVVAFAGDVNGDGFGDIAVAAPTESHGEHEEGRVYVYVGGPIDDADEDGVPDAADLCTGDDGSGDADADGWCALDPSGATEDCDDAVATTFPGAAELCDGVDSSCAGTLSADEADADADGVTLCDGDCSDTDSAIGPFATEVCDNLLDDDCDVGTPDSCPVGEPLPDDGQVTGGGGCTCATPGGGLAPWLVVGLAALVVRRRRSAGP